RFGETGEVYLVGPDARMRSDARAFVEEPALYLAQVDELGAASSEEQHQMAALGTTVLFQDVDGKAVRAALQGQQGLISSTNYLGEDVYTAYQPLDSEAFSWIILAEQHRSEVDSKVNDYVQDNLALVTVLIVVLTFFAVAWAGLFVRPLRRISAALEQIREGSHSTLIPSGGAKEFRVLSGHLNTMVESLSGRDQAVSDALERKIAILRTLLPAAVADAVIDGDSRLVETIPQASVVVFIVDGLAEMFRTRDANACRALMNSIVDAADGLADAGGLERIKVMGDTYYAVCGTETPYLDHAPRAARFATRVRHEVRRLADEGSLDLDVTVGIQSGPITVGLIGESRLVYDLWGDTVDQAYALARAGGRGEILVTDSVRDRLPNGEDLRSFASGDVAAWEFGTVEETQEAGS
ncbi:MAG: adenylate/guanylate cyclase domain-containing protein, partial [Actinomycetota bacterium]|nr:adenylate/guanylate cyclase domain-containing protein [Actinomycetota bacterium]